MSDEATPQPVEEPAATTSAPAEAAIADTEAAIADEPDGSFEVPEEGRYVPIGAVHDLRNKVKELKPQAERAAQLEQELAGGARLAKRVAELSNNALSVQILPAAQMGGQRLTTEYEVETGVPVLSKIPILNRFFTNRIESKEEQTLLILIKPTVLIQNENEEVQFPGLLDSIRAGMGG